MSYSWKALEQRHCNAWIENKQRLCKAWAVWVLVIAWRMEGEGRQGSPPLVDVPPIHSRIENARVSAVGPIRRKSA